MTSVFKLTATEGAGWVRQVIDGRPIVTGAAEEAAEWTTRSEAARVANELNRRRKVQWRPVETDATPGGPYRFDPTNVPIR
ncbi:MAG TPA: hypothetical protein VHD87_15500 [Acidimicrobiales bacterium]|nr:hypothetical protein [Acidimicrobiales bacterium]